jgi:hypothetical protein
MIRQLTEQDLKVIEELCKPFEFEGSVTLRKELMLSLLNEVRYHRDRHHGLDRPGARRAGETAGVNMAKILPTHTCFDDAIELLGEFTRQDLTATLVHGIAVGDDGTRYAHAWVEADGLAWEAGLLEDGRRVRYSVSQLEYYRARRIKRAWHYAVGDMLAVNRRTNSYGPWEPELQALCRAEPRILGATPATLLKAKT